MYDEGDSSQGRAGLTGDSHWDGWRAGDGSGLASVHTHAGRGLRGPPLECRRASGPPHVLRPACRAEPAFLGTVLLFPSTSLCGHISHGAWTRARPSAAAF